MEPRIDYAKTAPEVVTVMMGDRHDRDAPAGPSQVRAFQSETSVSG